MNTLDTSTSDDMDVLIVGAGMSGIGAAYYLQRDLPQMTYAIVEAREDLGGTWDLFRYPGIRSDSDLHSFGYAFKPWTHENALASGEAILAYLKETVEEHGIGPHIRFRHAVKRASWSSETARWTVEIERGEDTAPVTLRCRFLFMGTGYYRYDQGYRPHFEGEERFGGQLIHPQHWPEGLDFRDKRVVIIGSGATAVTLVPAMAETAAHVTMLQRTPTYVLSLPQKDRIARLLKKVLPEKTAHALIRRKNVALQLWFHDLSKRFPKHARALIRVLTVRQLPKGYPVDEHFNPPYDPWDQRLCAVPDGDLFKAIAQGRASIVTDRIETFTEKGLRLASGKELEADLVITATGLNLQIFGGIEVSVDGEPLRASERLAFRGMMLEGVPNFVFAIGYTNAPWTLKVGLVSEHFCRLVAHMEAHGKDVMVPTRTDPNMETRPLLDFGAGYVQRSLAELPRQGASAPWVMPMNYFLDEKLLREGPVEDPNLLFSASSGSQRVGVAGL